MPSIFLSHASIDKPFVEKLAKDLKGIGINVWYDKWEIKVGESITWKIEEGIRENEYFGIVLSPEAMNSEWVKNELSSGWVKQMQTRKIVVLPIYYRDCDIPLFLADRKYADFRVDYQQGFTDLAEAMGIVGSDVISKDNWRRFTKRRNSNWHMYRELEFAQLVTILVDRAYEYNWSTWVGGKRNPYSITLSAYIDQIKKQSISIKLDGRTFAYLACFKDEINPNRLKASDFTFYIGNTINECEEYIWRKMEDFEKLYGRPPDKSTHFTERFLNIDEKMELIIKFIKDLRWYKGDKLVLDVEDN